MRARAALDGGNVATVSPGKPHARELHTATLRKCCLKVGKPPRARAALFGGGNVATTENGQTPRVRAATNFRRIAVFGINGGKPHARELHLSASGNFSLS